MSYEPAELWPFVCSRSRAAYASHLRSIAAEAELGEEWIVIELLSGPDRARSFVARWCGSPAVERLAASTRRARLATMRAIVSSAGASYALPRVRVPPAARARYGLEPAEISRMILGARSALRQNVAARFEVLARLGFEHGLRIGEICSLRDDAIGRSIRVRRKGGNRDDRPVGVALGTAIDTWRQLRPGATDGSLLVALDGPTIGRAWAARSARAHLATVALRTLGRSVPPHALRHAGATRVLEATGGNVRALQSWGRWSSPQIAMRYDDDVQDPAGELAAMLAAELAVPPARFARLQEQQPQQHGSE